MAVSLYSAGSTDALLAAKLSDAPIDGSTYGRKDAAWEVVSGGSPFNGGTVTTPITVDESAGSGFISTLSGAQLSFDGTGCYISGEETTAWGFTISNCPAINFADSTSQTTAGVSNDKAMANAFAASMWYLWDGFDYARNGVVNVNYIGGSYLSAGISDGTTFAAGFPATNATLNSGSYWYVSINGTLSDIYIFSP
jgi:hypothetical protein